MYQQDRTRFNRQAVKTYDIHPISIKQIQKGHPWVTVDQFSEKFHPKEKFIVAANRKKPFALLLHDPAHKDVRARVWATEGNFQKQMKSFKNDLIARIRKAVTKRSKSAYTKDRNHFYLIFAEGDDIPGILVQYLNGELLIQFYMEFWEPFKDFFIQNLVKETNHIMKLDISFENIWIQKRSLHKMPAKCSDHNTSFRNIEIEEFGVKYKVTLGKYYDHGIYTDMASIRKRITPSLKESKSVLNLYSYTGAFSLYALKQGAEKVVSVDLSQDYLDWLEENIKLNEDFKAEAHQSICGATKESIKKLKADNVSFDFIISDPPSSSSDGNKRTNALQDYQELLPEFHELLTENGKCLVFINTHKISLRKFEEKLKQIIEKNKLSFSIKSKYYLSEDCPSKKGFPEGNYLKGFLLQKS